MTKQKSLLPKVELLIIIVFFVSFSIWAISKCSSGRKAMEAEEQMLEQPPTDTSSVATDGEAEKEELPKIITEEVTPLYVTIDGLNMREAPDLNSPVITRLELFERVIFMNEVTDSTYQISLGYEVADEPWVKVKHKKGKVGWVYGAGVNYYKKKREGVLE